MPGIYSICLVLIEHHLSLPISLCQSIEAKIKFTSILFPKAQNGQQLGLGSKLQKCFQFSNDVRTMFQSFTWLQLGWAWHLTKVPSKVSNAHAHKCLYLPRSKGVCRCVCMDVCV